MPRSRRAEDSRALPTHPCAVWSQVWSAVTRHRFGEATGRPRMIRRPRTRGHATAGASRERPIATARPPPFDGDESPWESGDKSPHSKEPNRGLSRAGRWRVRTHPWGSEAVVARSPTRATRPYPGRAGRPQRKPSGSHLSPKMREIVCLLPRNSLELLPLFNWDIQSASLLG